VRGRGQARLVQDGLRANERRALGEPVEATEEDEVLDAGDALVGRVVAGLHERDAAGQRGRAGPAAEHAYVARGPPDPAGQHAQQRALSGGGAAEDPVHLTGGDRQTDVAKNLARTEVALEGTHRDRMTAELSHDLRSSSRSTKRSHTKVEVGDRSRCALG